MKIIKLKNTILGLGVLTIVSSVFQSCENDIDLMDNYSSEQLITEQLIAEQEMFERFTLEEAIGIASDYVSVENNDKYVLNLSEKQAQEYGISSDSYTELLDLIDNLNAEIQIIQVSQVPKLRFLVDKIARNG